MTAPTPREQVAAYVTLHADTNSTPALTPDEVATIVDQHAIADPAGLPPAADGWQPTYWRPRAVQAAWELRAARAATIVDTAQDGTTITGSQLSTQLAGQALRWAARCAGGVS